PRRTLEESLLRTLQGNVRHRVRGLLAQGAHRSRQTDAPRVSPVGAKGGPRIGVRRASPLSPCVQGDRRPHSGAISKPLRGERRLAPRYLQRVSSTSHARMPNRSSALLPPAAPSTTK